MFFMDVPYAPMQDTPIVLAQVAALGTTQQPDYLLKACTEFSSGGGGPVDPAGMLAANLGNRDHRYITPAAVDTIKLTQLEGTTHGELIPLTSGSGRLYYKYIAADYLGKDKAVFMAEFEGKRYKVVVNFVITVGINENDPQCPPAQLIKVTKPSSGSSGFDLNGITVNITDLTGAAN